MCCHCIHRWNNASDQGYYTQLLLIAMLTINFVQRVSIVFYYGSVKFGLGFSMNATVFEIDYWYFMTQKMHLDWISIVFELLLLLILCVLAIAYAWSLERDTNRVQVNKKRDIKLRTVLVFA